MAKVHSIDLPIENRRRKPRKKIIKGLAFIIYSIIAVVFFIFILSFSFIIYMSVIVDPRYVVQEIKIDGLKYYSDVEIRKVLEKYMNQRMGSINENDIKNELLHFPYIGDCSVEKIREENRIIIKVQELPPFATLFVDDQLFLISHTGKILKRIPNVKEAVGPLITGVFPESNIEPGAYIVDDSLWTALEFWYEYNQVPKSKNIRISEIVIISPENLKVFFDEIPCETRWKKENLKRQLQNFSIALNKVDLTHLQYCEYIDMRFNDDIIYK